MKAKAIIDFMNVWAPKKLAEEWDNIGFQIGNDEKEIKNILLALDIDHRVLRKAKEKNIDMIITHHPFIFKGVKTINNKTYKGKIIMELIKNDILIYNAHTNLDKTYDGVNEELARLFNLKEIEILTTTDKIDDKFYGYGRLGKIDKIKLKDFIREIKSKLNVKNLIVYGDLDRQIEKLALVGGSGSSFIEEAFKKRADLIITGDIKYHDGQLADQLGISIIDAGHFHTEKVILPVIKNKLKKLDESLTIYIYEKPSPPYEII